MPVPQDRLETFPFCRHLLLYMPALKGMPLQLFFVHRHVLSAHTAPGPWPAYPVPSFLSCFLRTRSLPCCFWFKALTTSLASLLAKALFPCLVRWIPSLPRNLTLKDGSTVVETKTLLPTAASCSSVQKYRLLSLRGMGCAVLGGAVLYWGAA